MIEKRYSELNLKIEPLTFLLIFVPLTLLFEILHFPSLLIFISSALGIVPLAKWMGVATEEISKKLGEGLGGLMNATFGNATELIIAVFALQRGLIDIVEASITGSIVSNFLFVLGLAMLLGGWRRKKQTFNRTAASMRASLLTLATIGLVLPAVFAIVSKRTEFIILEEVSIGVATFLMVSYIISLYFSLKTHKHLYGGVEEHIEKMERNEKGWNNKKPIIVLTVATIFVAIMSEILVGVIGQVAESIHLSEFFIGVILIPLIGNAAEHLTAVTVAMKNKMNLALNIAVGSSTQIALFVAPLLVFISLYLGNPMQLIFNELEVVTVGVSVYILNTIVTDGESNWLEGFLLIISYFVIATVFFFI